MKVVIQRAWPAFLFSGILSLCFGILVWAWPDITLVALVWMFAIPVIIHGISYVVAAIRGRHEHSHWILLLLLGIINGTAGLLAVLYPGITSLFLVKVMGATWLVAGLLQVFAAIQLRREIVGEVWLAIAGLASVIVGLFVLINPASSALTLLWLIGLYAVLFGIVMIIFGIRAKRWRRSFYEDIMQ
jgi:uncharacterized membrane protein HdeD (DUF308 family)